MIWLAAIVEAAIENWDDFGVLVAIQFLNASLSYYETVRDLPPPLGCHPPPPASRHSGGLSNPTSSLVSSKPTSSRLAS